MNTSSAPLRQTQRIHLIDTIRGVALMGILLMNIPFFSGPEAYAFNLNARNEYSGPNYYSWWIVYGGFEGTMRSLFSLLFGAGCILLLNRLEKKGPSVNAADIYYRRLLWLFLFGLINAFLLLWPGDILYAYSICGLFLFPFRKLKAKYLLFFALGFFLIATIKGTYNMYSHDKMKDRGMAALALEKQKKTLTEEQMADKGKWIAFQEKMQPANIRKSAEKEIDIVGSKGYFSILAHYSTIIAFLESTKFYHNFFFDIMFLLFLGMAFFKWGILTGQRPKKFYWLMLLAGYGLGLPLSYWEHQQYIQMKFDLTQMFDRFVVDVYQVRRILLALGHLSLLVLIYKSGLVQRLMNALAKVGQMAFTNYLMQSIICAIIFYGFGFGLYGRLERFETYYVVLCIWIFQVIFSNIWLHYFRFGPFEWVWRSLTYWKKQTMRRKAVTEEDSLEGETPAPALA